MIFLFFLLLFSSKSSILGIDFGSNFVKICIVSPGHKFKIALDSNFQRKHPTIVGSFKGERQFGNEANFLLIKKPNTTFRYMQRLLGKSINNPVIDEIRSLYFPYKFILNDQRNTIRVQINNENETFLIEEIVAMYLQHAQNVANNHINVNFNLIKDCVITVPDFFSTKERKALLNATNIAKLNVINLINENGAVALKYGINYPYKIRKKEYYAFYNMGSSSTIVNIVKYHSFLHKITRWKNKTVGVVEILSQEWDENLGGNNFDLVIMNTIKNRIKQKRNVNLTLDYRAMARLRIGIEKVKRILSLNKDTLVHIPSLWNDIDLNEKYERIEFHHDSFRLYKRAMKPLIKVLKRLNLDSSQLNGIVLMGGGTRIPKLQEILIKTFNVKLRKDLNTDESAAVGASFLAANESTTFKVKKIGFIDRHPWTFNTSILNQNKNDNLTLVKLCKCTNIFEKSILIKHTKKISFKHNKNLYVTISFKKKGDLPLGTTQLIEVYKVNGIISAIKQFNLFFIKPKVFLIFQTTKNSIVQLLEAKIIFNNSKIKDGIIYFLINKKNELRILIKSIHLKKEKIKGIFIFFNEYYHRWKIGKVQLKLKIKSVGSDVIPMSDNDINKSKLILLDFYKRDYIFQEISHNFNDLETFILQSRYFLKKKIKLNVNEIFIILKKIFCSSEKWIYEREQNTKQIVYNSKLIELLKRINYIFKNSYEFQYSYKALLKTREHLKIVYKKIRIIANYVISISQEKKTKINNGIKNLKVLLSKNNDKEVINNLIETNIFAQSLFRRFKRIKENSKFLLNCTEFKLLLMSNQNIEMTNLKNAKRINIAKYYDCLP